MTHCGLLAEPNEYGVGSGLLLRVPPQSKGFVDCNTGDRDDDDPCVITADVVTGAGDDPLAEKEEAFGKNGAEKIKAIEDEAGDNEVGPWAREEVVSTADCVISSSHGK